MTTTSRVVGAPTLIIVGTLVASLMSTTMFLGEALFAMSWFVVYVSLGIWAARFFKRDYSPSG